MANQESEALSSRQQDVKYRLLSIYPVVTYDRREPKETLGSLSRRALKISDAHEGNQTGTATLIEVVLDGHKMAEIEGALKYHIINGGGDGGRGWVGIYFY